MATFEEAFAALDDYRSSLMDAQQSEDVQAAVNVFSARGAFSAFSTPLSNVHATGVGVRIRNGRIIDNDFVLKVFVFDKQDLGTNTPTITRREFQGVGID